MEYINKMRSYKEIEKRIETKALNQDSLNFEITYIKDELNKVIAEKEKYSEMASKLQMQLNDLIRMRRNAINLSKKDTSKLKYIIEE